MYSKPNREVYLCSELVDAVYRPTPDSCEVLTANLEEISEHSLLLAADAPIPPGVEIEVQCKSRDLKGMVAAIEFDELLGWFIHVELEADPQVGTEFVPQHLLAIPAGCSTRDLQRAFHWPLSKVA